jgi:TonB-dependent SusC/RagA subfamily outer membrane receptor
MNPLGERLVFNKNDDQARIVFSSDKKKKKKREKVLCDIRLTDPEGTQPAGHVSIAVTDDRDITVDSAYTIQSSLLLSSELKGFIESPGYYLQDDTLASQALDLLMRTHGWRRYDISEVIKGNYQLPRDDFEVNKTISGSVTGGLKFDKPVVNGEVLIISNEKGVQKGIETETNGLFSFPVHYSDSVKFFVQAKNQKGGTDVQLTLHQEQFPALKSVPKSQTPASPVAAIRSQTKDGDDVFIKKAEQRAQYDDDMRHIQLKEVEVTAKRISKKDEARLFVYPFNACSDYTVYREDFGKRTPKSVSDMLLGVSGIFIDSHGGVRIRGESEAYPLVVIDGIEIDNSEWGKKETKLRSGIHEGPLERVSATDVESIDIFKGATSGAIFGFRGANGVISITTRRGGSDKSYSDENRSNVASYSPIGSQKPVEFYSPKYDTPESKLYSIPDLRSTVFWKPDLIIPSRDKASFEFYTSDFPTTYTVVFEGLTHDGKILRQVEKIEVR